MYEKNIMISILDIKRKWGKSWKWLYLQHILHSELNVVNVQWKAISTRTPYVLILSRGFRYWAFDYLRLRSQDVHTNALCLWARAARKECENSVQLPSYADPQVLIGSVIFPNQWKSLISPTTSDQHSYSNLGYVKPR